MGKHSKKSGRRGSVGIHIDGGKSDPAGVSAVSYAIRMILETAHASYADQETVRHALSVFRECGGVHNTSITSSNISVGR